MKLLWDVSTVNNWIFVWIARKVIFLGSKGQKKVKFVYFAAFCKFSQKRFDNFFLFLYEDFSGYYVSNVKSWIRLNRSKGNFKGQKGQVWPIFPYLSILFSINEVLPIFIALCIFGVKPIMS